MKTLTIEAVRVNPEILSVLHARARRARAATVHNAFVGLLQRLKPRLPARTWGLHWG